MGIFKEADMNGFWHQPPVNVLLCLERTFQAFMG
jgi:hypothetical protein